MKLKKCLAGCLCAVMLIGLSACGNSEGIAETRTTGQEKNEESVQSQAMETAQSDNVPVSENESNDESVSASDILDFEVDWEDMADIKVIYLSGGPIPSGLAEVEAGINEITESAIHTHVNLQMIEIGSYAQQVSLMMSSNEQVDLLMTFPGGSPSFSAMQSQGQLMDITDLLEEYGQAALDTVGDYIKATTVNGKIYAVPTYRLYAGSQYIVMRTDVLEDLGLLEQAENIQTLKDYEAILEAVHSSEKWSRLSGIAPASGDGNLAFVTETFAGIDTAEDTIFDGLTDRQLFMIKADDESATILLTPTTDEYKAEYELIHSWYEKGYVYKDSATSTETATELIKADKCFSCITGAEIGVEASYSASCQRPVTCVELSKRLIATRNATQFTWSVPVSAKYPEAAVAFMSLLYTSPEINNLLAWGVEGRDYVIKDGVAVYPDGNSEVPYHSADFIIGNQFLVTPWDGQDPDLREQAKAAMAEAPTSPYLGFTCDTSNISTELSAINNVVEEYRKQINTGTANPGIIEEYVEKLQSVNVQKVIDEYQKQLNAWLENK